MSRRLFGLLLGAGLVDRMPAQKIPVLRAMGRALVILGIVALFVGKFTGVIPPAVGFFAALLGGLFLVLYQLGASHYGWAAITILSMVLATCAGIVATGG